MRLDTDQHDALPSLHTHSVNLAFYKALTMADQICDIGDIAGYSYESKYRLLRVDQRLDTTDEDQFEIALVDDEALTVIYYARVALVLIPKVSDQYFARHRVWRSADSYHSLALHGISEKVLYHYIVLSNDLLLTEQAVSGSGHFYLLRQVSRAIEHGLYVYAYELANQTLRLIPSQLELSDIENTVWSVAGEDPIMALISKNPLHGH
ncbi:hypothetical protein [Pseudomonas sp. CJQ_11]|uniref:hypothetical protein n=1 Tax=Pseudomonas sp. CJQ_11 TaxID=3367169 RepID=UPI00370C58D8